MTKDNTPRQSGSATEWDTVALMHGIWPLCNRNAGSLKRVKDYSYHRKDDDVQNMLNNGVPCKLSKLIGSCLG
ncbi:hypothetical protein Tco_1568948 [Tanacetum coccineum]